MTATRRRGEREKRSREGAVTGAAMGVGTGAMQSGLGADTGIRESFVLVLGEPFYCLCGELGET